MGFWNTAASVALNVVRAWMQAGGGTPAPGAPAPAATVATVAGTAITFGQLVAAASALKGSDLGSEFQRLIHNLGDVDNDLDVTMHVAKTLAPFVPVAGEIATAAFVLKLGFDVGRALYIAHPEAFAPAPRGGPPITEADWSHGVPRPQTVDNPSGAIGGAS
jgi:hypothetical protein